jgi:tRNA threonylcarbamoyladenosine biosynthesis protein TsaB
MLKHNLLPIDHENYTPGSPRVPFFRSERAFVLKILSLETTDLTGSVAAGDGSKVLLELELNPQQRSAQSLAPAIRSLLQQVGWQPAEVQLVAVTVGPGSFTGLRVGVTTAKTFAYAVGAEILGIDTLETIAANITVTQKRAGASSPPALEQETIANEDFSLLSQLEVVLDAQRGEVVTCSFSPSDDGWFHPAGQQRLVPIDPWLAELSLRGRGRPGSQDIAVTGPILKKLQSRIPPGIMVLDERFWHPRAAQVARLAARDYAAGRRDDLWTLLPHYSRRSAAEEKLEKA